MFKSVSFVQSVVAKLRKPTSWEEKTHFSMRKNYLFSAYCKCPSVFHRVACLVQGHPDPGSLDRSLKGFHLYKQLDVSWRNINQHWTVRVKSYFLTSRYSLCARLAVLHAEISPWTSSAVQAQVFPGRAVNKHESLSDETGTTGEGVVWFLNRLFLLLDRELQLIFH